LLDLLSKKNKKKNEKRFKFFLSFFFKLNQKAKTIYEIRKKKTYFKEQNLNIDANNK